MKNAVIYQKTNMDLSYAGYLLFVVPGFCVVWTYRHFTKNQKIGEFEYAVWSFLWGVPPFLLFGYITSWQKTSLPAIPLNNPGVILGSFVGTSVAITIGGSFALGFIAALFSRAGLFGWIDKKISWLLDKSAGTTTESDKDNTIKTD